MQFSVLFLLHYTWLVVRGFCFWKSDCLPKSCKMENITRNNEGYIPECARFWSYMVKLTINTKIQGHETMCRIYKQTKRRLWSDVRLQAFVVVVVQVTVVLVLTVCWIVSLFVCFGGTFASIFRVTEFGAGGCWSDWGQRQSQYDWQEVSPSWCHPLIRPEDLKRTVNVSVVLSLYVFPKWLEGGNVLNIWEGCKDFDHLELWKGEVDLVRNHWELSVLSVPHRWCKMWK
jgi:hypothetical protein